MTSGEEAEYIFLSELQTIVNEYDIDIYSSLNYKIFLNADGQVNIVPQNGFTSLLFYGIYVDPKYAPKSTVIGYEADYSTLMVRIVYLTDEEEENG